uniref:Uncharacterized protein n=1 Tax=Arion vulgaris TaxID=1028688 RepID=A0A0B7AJJ3_9EUPU
MHVTSMLDSISRIIKRPCSSRISHTNTVSSYVHTLLSIHFTKTIVDYFEDEYAPEESKTFLTSFPR